MKQKFMWFFDFQTVADDMTVITVKAGGKHVVDRLSPFFGAYKYFKLGRVSVKFVPASTLPMDPLGLSYADDDFNTVDPRDQLSMGLTRITNGEDIRLDLDGVPTETQRAIYNSMLLDPRWYKFRLQSGLSRTAYPKMWSVAQVHRDMFPGRITNMPGTYWDWQSSNGTNQLSGMADDIEAQMPGILPVDQIRTEEFPGSSNLGLFQSGRKEPLGWLPTDNYVPVLRYTNSEDPAEATVEYKATGPQVPEIELFQVIMPPMYKTSYYFRAYVTEEVFFKTPVTINAAMVGNGYVRGLDRFVQPIPSEPHAPTVATRLDTYVYSNNGQNRLSPGIIKQPSTTAPGVGNVGSN